METEQELGRVPSEPGSHPADGAVAAPSPPIGFDPSRDASDEYPDEYDDYDECWNCAGEGYVYDCFEEFACIDPEGGCDLCMRRCDVCRPRKPDPALQAILAEALARDSDGSPKGGGAQQDAIADDSAVPERQSPNSCNSSTKG